jgi:hypothetical protein
VLPESHGRDSSKGGRFVNHAFIRIKFCQLRVACRINLAYKNLFQNNLAYDAFHGMAYWHYLELLRV